jgi:hypothetical protein
MTLILLLTPALAVHECHNMFGVLTSLEVVVIVSIAARRK